MARSKHPHRLIHIRGTWKCADSDCSFFIHDGQAHLILGKNARCMECGEIYIADEHTLKDKERGICYECKSGVSELDIDAIIAETARKNAIKSSFGPSLHPIDLPIRPERRTEHAPDCDAWDGDGWCSCGLPRT